MSGNSKTYVGARLLRFVRVVAVAFSAGTIVPGLVLFVADVLATGTELPL
jgi:hypothetical protein